MDESAGKAQVIEFLDSQSFDGIDAALVKLESFFELLVKWQRVQNLVSRETLNQFWSRHVLDSVQILEHIYPDSKTILDLGSGGGFPAIPLAILLSVQNEFMVPTIHLVDSNRRKVSFLRQVSRELGLNTQVHPERLENLQVLDLPTVDLITSRATAELQQILTWCAPVWQAKTKAVLHKGQNFRAELEQAHRAWSFDHVETQSKTESSAVILEITGLQPR